MKIFRKRQKKTFFKSGVPSLIGISAMFLVGGIIATTSPIAYFSSGGIGRHGATTVTITHSTNETQAWGIIFLAMGLFFLYCAFSRQRDKKMK
jgi:hypothetical protein